MRIVHTIASTRLDHGGTSRSVPALCEAIGRRGADVHLVAGRPADEDIACGWPRDSVAIHSVRESSVGRCWGIERRFREELAGVCVGADGSIVHDHGLWLATNHAVAGFARKYACARVVSPRGMLSRWAIHRGRYKKCLAWWAYQRRDLESATAFHATSQEEAAEIRALGLRQPIAVVPNGIEPPASIQRPELNGHARVLFLSRIHPKKGLINLVRAWKAVQPSPEWELIIAGPDENGHRAEVESLVRSLGLGKEVTFIGEVDDARKWELYASADVFVLPSFSENFGICVAEALACGIPVITTTGTPWQELPRLGFGWQSPPTEEGISESLRQAIRMPQAELRARGAAAAEWARSSFSWEEVAQKMISFYQWIGDGGGHPSFVE